MKELNNKDFCTLQENSNDDECSFEIEIRNSPAQMPDLDNVAELTIGDILSRLIENKVPLSVDYRKAGLTKTDEKVNRSRILTFKNTKMIADLKDHPNYYNPENKKK